MPHILHLLTFVAKHQKPPPRRCIVLRSPRPPRWGVAVVRPRCDAEMNMRTRAHTHPSHTHKQGVIGKQLKTFKIVEGTVNYEFGFVECPQPDSLALTSVIGAGEKLRRMRVEVALNGRDFSFSALNPNGPMGLVFFDEPWVTTFEPTIGPISGNTTIVITGENFRTEASEWHVPNKPPSQRYHFPERKADTDKVEDSNFTSAVSAVAFPTWRKPRI